MEYLSNNYDIKQESLGKIYPETMEDKKNIIKTISGEIAESNVSMPVKEVPMGILRLDLGKPRRLSAEFKLSQKEIVSPQPSIDRLSVTFAEDSLKSDSSKCNLNLGPSRMQQLQQQQSLQYQQDKVQFPEESLDGNESDEEDYSASVNAIIQRRASTRRSKKQSRRASSPFIPETPGPERRRSSVFTTSSGDTAITVDDNPNNDVTQDEIFENIKLHKEVLSSVKMQPWNMRKKLKLVLQAKAYIKKHEGQLQERLAQSHSTKDMLARWNIVLIKKWQKWKREITNMSMWFIPWELKIKEIESHFGSVVASYFIFLRWLFWVNIVIAVVIISFVTIPEIITADPEAVKDRKFVLPEEKYNSTNFLTLWDFEGVFKYSPLFYGWYTNRDYNDSAVLNSYDRKNTTGRGYRLPFAYFVTGLVVYAYSFFATLRKMAENSRMSKLSEKDDECIFSWKLFTAWDYMIGNAETAHNRVASIVMGFKEALLEEAEKKRESRNWKVICIRILVNALVAGLLSCSVVAVVIVVRRSMDSDANSTVWRRNEITVVITLITLFFPMLFEVLGLVEQYHPRKQLRLQLARIMVLNLLNLYSLIFALFDKIDDMTILLKQFKANRSKDPLTDTFFYTTPLTFDSGTTPFYEDSPVNCVCNNTIISNQNAVISLDMISTIAQNLSVFALPKLKELAYILHKENLSESTLSNNLLTSTQETVSNMTEAFFNLSSSFSSESTTSSPDNFTYYFENGSLYWEDNNTEDWNHSIFNHSKTLLAGFDFNDTFSIDDLTGIFVDYLTYILSPFIINSTDFEHINVNFSLNNSYEIENTTSAFLNLSSMDYEYFKSTVLPLFNNTMPQEAVRFETELSSVFIEISTTIATWPDILSTGVSIYTTEYEEVTNSSEDLNCLNYCKTLFESKSSAIWPGNITSTAIATINYEDVEYRKILNYTMKAKLRSLCWETMFGQELLKLTLLDLIMSGLSILFMDFIRGIFVRFMNRCWCWDLEKKFPQYGDFKVAENILHLVNNQGMVWMGMFFSPGLVVLNVAKLYIMMYLRAWAVLTCNVPHEIIFRASRSNNFYYALLLMMLFLCVLPVGYAIVWIEPSWHCGPFSGYQRIFHIFTNTIRANVPGYLHRALDYIASPGIVIPLLLLLVLIIYYLVSLTGALREANNDLKTQLRRERTEERRKMFQLADRRRRGGSGESNDQTPFSKWKKLMGNLPTTRSCDEPRQESEDRLSQKEDEEDEKIENKGKVFFTKLIKKALGKSSTSEDEQDATDTEQHESLPYDNNKDGEKEGKSMKASPSGGSLEPNALQSIVNRLRRNSHKAEKDPDQKITEEGSENINKKADKEGEDGKRTSENERQELVNEKNKSKTKVERTKKLFSHSHEENVEDKSDIDKRKPASRKPLFSDIDINKAHSSKSSPRSKRQAEVDTSTKVLKNTSGKQKKSTAFKDEYVVPSKHSRAIQKHSRTQKADEGNVFLKRVIEAKKAGVFKKEENVVVEKEPRASTSYESKHKRAREKDYSKIVKSKPKRPIIEMDEENSEDERLDNTFSKIKDSIVTTVDTHTENSKKAAVRQDSSSSIWSDKIPVITISKTYSDENILGKEEPFTSSTKNTEGVNKGKYSNKNTADIDDRKEGIIKSTNKEDLSETMGVRQKFVFSDDTDDYDDDEDDKDDDDKDKNNDKTEVKKLQHSAKNLQSNNQNVQSAKVRPKFRPRIRCVLKKQVTAIDEDIIIHFGKNLEKAEAEKQLIKSFRDEEIGDSRNFLEEEGDPLSPTLNLTSRFRFSTEDKFLAPNLEAGTSRSEEGGTSDRSTSEDTELKEDSIDTVLNSPYYLPEDNDNLDIITTIKPNEGHDSLDSQTDLELEKDINDSIEYETEFNFENTEESSDVGRDEASGIEERNITQLQRPSLRSSSRSQTESSCYYNE